MLAIRNFWVQGVRQCKNTWPTVHNYKNFLAPVHGHVKSAHLAMHFRSSFMIMHNHAHMQGWPCKAFFASILQASTLFLLTLKPLPFSECRSMLIYGRWM